MRHFSGLKPSKLLFLLCLLIPVCFLPAACASRGTSEPGAPNRDGREGKDTEDAPAEPGEYGTITGKISVKGNEPKTFVALTTEEGRVYEITGPLTDRLAEDYQYSTVILEGKLIRASTGPGMPARFRAEKIVGDG